MQTIRYSITPHFNGYIVRILKKGKLATQPQVFFTKIDCLNFVNNYCIENNVFVYNINPKL
jgi:hypothetical protein